MAGATCAPIDVTVARLERRIGTLVQGAETDAPQVIPTTNRLVLDSTTERGEDRRDRDLREIVPAA
jgi:hypothetical protein